MSFKGDSIYLFLAFESFFEEKAIEEKQSLDSANSGNREAEISNYRGLSKTSESQTSDSSWFNHRQKTCEGVLASA